MALIDQSTTYLYIDLDLTQHFVQGSELVDKGDWSAVAFYNVGDVVFYSDCLYYALAINSNTPPTAIVDLNWSACVIVEEGAGTSAATGDSVARALALEALYTAWAGTYIGNLAWTLAQVGTNTGSAAYALADFAGDLALDAYRLAQVGTNTGSAAYDLANGASSIAITAYTLAQIGTNTGSAAYALADSASDLALDAYRLAQVGTNTGTAALDAAAAAQSTANGAFEIAVTGTTVAYAAYALAETGTNLLLIEQGTRAWKDQDLQNQIDSNPVIANQPNYLIAGGNAIWTNGYTFIVAPATISFNGVIQDFAGTTITLDSADPADDRIDLIIADSTYGTITNLTGSASTPPALPDYDPVTQFQLSFIPVDAGTTEPTDVVRNWIYRENTEWNTAVSGATVDPDSTADPYEGSKAVEATNAVTNNFIRFIAPNNFDLNQYDLLYFHLKPKAPFGSAYLRLHWVSSGGARRGNYVSLTSGSFGFNSNYNAYQTITIPLSFFAVPAGQTIQRLYVYVMGGTTGWFMDDVAIQANIASPLTVDNIVLADAGTNTDGEGLAAGRDGYSLLVKRLQAGANVALSSTGSNVEISVALGETADSAYALAQIGTNTGTAAYSLASSAFNYAQSAFAIAVDGTNVANEAWRLAQVGTNTGTAAYDRATSALSYGQSAFAIAVDGTNVANAAYALAMIGTNTGSAAYNLANNKVSRSGDTMTGALTVPNLVYNTGTQAWTGTVTLDFDGTGFQTVILNGDVYFTATNQIAGRSVTARLLASAGSNPALNFNSDIRFVGDKPTSLTNGKVAILSLTAFSNTLNDTVAAYAAET